MTDEPDPNADLVGYEFDSEHGRLRVVGSAAWSPTYVECRKVGTDGLTLRSAALVRAAKVWRGE